jgi:hypothetical protein
VLQLGCQAASIPRRNLRFRGIFYLLFDGATDFSFVMTSIAVQQAVFIGQKAEIDSSLRVSDIRLSYERWFFRAIPRSEVREVYHRS